MKLSRIVTIVMLIGGISTLALSCASKASAGPTTTSQTVDVKRGNLSLSITTVGNLVLSQKEELAFEIPGTVQEVLVNAGDTVQKGQVLATLDTTQWDTQVTALQRAVTTAGRQVTQKQLALRNAQNAVVNANNTVISRQFALRSAQLNLQSANDTLNQITDIKKIQDVIDDANYALQFVNKMLGGQFPGASTLTDYNYWSVLQTNAKQALAQANTDMKTLLAGTSTTVPTNVLLAVAIKQLAVEQAQLGITQAQLDLQNAQLAVSDAQNAISPAQEDVQNAQDDLKTAQTNLADVKNSSPEVKAPFNGFITAVGVKGGDEVNKGKIAVTIADPSKFEAAVQVNETDISKIKLGGTATVALQAITGTSLSANITNIAPTPTPNQQNVVNYKVTVELQSLQPAAPALRQLSTSPTSGTASSGIPFGGGGQGSGSGNLTQAQISQIAQQRQQTSGAQAGRGGPGSGSGNLTQAQISQALQQRQQTSGGQVGRVGPGSGSGNLTQAQISQALQQRQQAAAGQAGNQASGSSNMTQAQNSQSIPQRQPAATGQTGGQSQTPGQSSRQSQAAASTANIKLAEG
ncbi:MAG: HlyD family efflux transporter periplasmic adaptor subunit, partial [Chloroflexota bacterium]